MFAHLRVFNETDFAQKGAAAAAAAGRSRVSHELLSHARVRARQVAWVDGGGGRRGWVLSAKKCCAVRCICAAHYWQTAAGAAAEPLVGGAGNCSPEAAPEMTKGAMGSSPAMALAHALLCRAELGADVGAVAGVAAAGAGGS